MRLECCAAPPFLSLLLLFYVLSLHCGEQINTTVEFTRQDSFFTCRVNNDHGQRFQNELCKLQLVLAMCVFVLMRVCV